jgi:N-acetylmuramoyl-L-alanine amidase
VRKLYVVAPLLLALAALPRAQEATATHVQTIVIDPGHGGDDSGARGANGTLEKQLALDVALRLRTLIETQHLLRVVLTREDDRLVSADERAAVANNNKADLLLSLHANASPSRAMAGAEVYYSAFDDSPAEPRPQAWEPFTLIPWNGAQARHFDTSARAAGIVHAALQKYVPVSDRSIRQAPLRAFSGAGMPAVLVELVFLSNPQQERAAATHEFKDRLAHALSEAVGRFRSFMETQPIP